MKSAFVALLLTIVTALPAHAQSTGRRFEHPEIGVAMHLRLTPDRVDDEAFSAALSLSGAPLPWLVIEAGFDGIVPSLALTHTLFVQPRFRLLRTDRSALALGSGIEWNIIPEEEDRRSNGELAPRTSWSVPLEASIEVRPVSGLTIRPYLGVRLPIPGFDCSDDAPESLCRVPTTLYLGTSLGWTGFFIREPRPAE
jgi:hypothetical protein